MSDLVERLRRAMTATEMEFITREAADEIERLRAELDGCKATEKDLGGIIRAQDDEIERLRSEPNDGWAAEAGGEVIRTARERYLIYATIERCAQVAERVCQRSGQPGKIIGAAIRALKDKP